LRAAAWAALATALAMLPAMSADMGGDLKSAFDPQTLLAVVTDTQLGKVWLARIALALAIAVLASGAVSGRSVWLTAGAGLLLASVALTGHSALPGGGLGLLHHLADILHLLAAGWWIGGLAALALASRDLGPQAHRVLSRFSAVGYGAVAAILLTGFFKSVLLVGSLRGLATAYGATLLAKVALVGAMGAFAMVNRFWITPGLARGGDAAAWTARLRRSVLIEFSLGIAVLAIVGALGAMAPPISQ
jgi:putative copper resistance protein D